MNPPRDAAAGALCPRNSPPDFRIELAELGTRDAERVQQLTALYELADGLHRSRSAADVHSAALRSIHTALHCQRASILLFDAAGVMRFVAWDGLSDDYRSAVEGHSPWAAEVADPTPLAIRDVDQADFGELLHAVLQREGIRALAFFPVVSGGKLIGKFMAYFDAPHEFTADEIQVGLAIARHLAFAIDRLQAEDARRDSEERFQSIADAAPVLIWMSGTNKLATWFNRPWLDFVGRTMEQQVGHGWTEHIHPDDRERCMQSYLRAFEARQPFSIDFRLRRHDGAYRWVIHQGTPRHDGHGRFAGYLGSCVDITERKQAEEARSKLAAIVEYSEDAIITKNLDGIITSWNRGAERIFGYTAAEVINQPITILIPEAYLGDEPRILDSIRRGNPIEHYETIRRRKNGTLIDISLTISPVRDERGQIIGASKVARDITKRKQAEEALRESEARYRAVIEAQTEMICRFQRDGTIAFVNSAYARARETSPEALIGANLWEFIPPEEHTAVRRMLQHLTPEQPEGRIENRFETADGPRWTLWVNRALSFDPTGHWMEAQSTGIDITERKRVEEQLRRNHETFFNLIHNAPFGVYVVDSQFRLAEVSAGSQKVFAGVRPLLGRDFAEVLRFVWAEPFATRAIELFRHTLVTGEPFHAPETTAPRSDIAELETYDWQIERITLPDGQYGVVCYFYDMTARRQAEDALRLNEERYRAIVAVITDVPWITDATGQFVTPQPAWALYTGQTWEEHRAFGWVNALHPDDRERLWREWEAGRASATRFESRGRFWHAASREWRHFVVKAAPRHGPDGTIVEWVGSCTDQEREIRAEQQLKQARDDALAANRAKDEFLATLSHELRTPLNPVLLVASDAATDTSLPEAVRQDFKMIADNVSLEARLIDDLLDLSRITRGKVTVEKEPLDLHLIVRDAAATMADDFAARGITTNFVLQASRTTVSGDPVRLRQVVWNVLKNALKFTPRGGTVEITTSNLGEGGAIEIRIRDTGIGITAEELEQVFQPFVQGGHASRPGGSTFGGLGLGLAIARALVEVHGGRIFAESPGLDRGTTVVMQFPTISGAAAAGAQLAASSARADGAPHAPRHASPAPRILFVDDHEPTRSTLTNLLQRRGYSVTAARSVADARHQAGEQPFDILVSDLGLPDGDGCTLMTELRKSRPTLPGIALSGYGMETDLARSRAAGFGVHLTKPVDIASLERALRQLLVAPPGIMSPR